MKEIFKKQVKVLKAKLNGEQKGISKNKYDAYKIHTLELHEIFKFTELDF